MEKEITLEAKDFANFVKCLFAVKDIFNDVNIEGGVLRQRSNDKSTIVEMDLTPLISDLDIPLSNVKNKLTSLKGLSKQKVQITITDDEVYFSGKPSTIKFKNPRRDFLDNKFMSSEQFSNLFTLREEDVVLEHLVTKDTSNFMKVTAAQLKIVSFQIHFDGNAASITASTSSKEQYSEIEYGIPTKKSLKCFSNVVATPFLLDRDGGMLFKMYNIQETVCINKSTSSIGKVAVDVYTRSQLMEEEE